MRTITRLMGISLLVFGLVGCDNDTKDNSVSVDNATASTPIGQQISLLEGKLVFTLPNGMADQSSKLGDRAKHTYVYADSSGQRALIVILRDKTADSLATLAQRLEEQQRSRDSNLQVVTNKAIEVNGTPLRQLDSIITSGGQKAYSSILLGVLNDQLLTIQITLPADNQQQAQSEAESIIHTLTLKK